MGVFFSSENSSDSETSGNQTKGNQTKGKETPGTPGTQTPGTQTPGKETPGKETQTPGTPGIKKSRSFSSFFKTTDTSSDKDTPENKSKKSSYLSNFNPFKKQVTELDKQISETERDELTEEEKKGDIVSGDKMGYGPVCIIIFLSVLWSRLSYMDPQQFLGHITKIYSDNEQIVKVLEAINEYIKKNGIIGILNDQEMLGLEEGKDSYGLATYTKEKDYQTYGKIGLKFLPWSRDINIINGEERKTERDPNCNFDVEIKENEEFFFTSIDTSNYSVIYVCRHKKYPNLIKVIFRGTSSFKSAGSYLKGSSLFPVFSGEIKNKDGKPIKEKFLYGVDKILLEVIHVLMHCIDRISRIKIEGCVGNLKILTTGHSLGGALCTIFAYHYVLHISSSTFFKKNYNQDLDTSICCIAIGAPRVFSKETADVFCALIVNPKDSSSENEFSSKDSSSGVSFSIDKTQFEGRIVYMRLTEYKDPVPGLPVKSLVDFVHPCSGHENEDPNTIFIKRRKDTTVDCLVQVTNSMSSRCRGKRLAMTYNHNLPLNCVDTKEKRKEDKRPYKGPWPILVNPVGYHMEYLGISFISGVELSKYLGNQIKRYNANRLAPGVNGDTVVRLIFYPNIKVENVSNAIQGANIGFYVLNDVRNKGFGAIKELESVNNSENKENEKEEENSKEEITEETKVDLGEDTPAKVNPLLASISGKPIQVPEDVYFTQTVFEKFLENVEYYDIKNVPPTLQHETLVNITGIPHIPFSLTKISLTKEQKTQKAEIRKEEIEKTKTNFDTNPKEETFQGKYLKQPSSNEENKKPIEENGLTEPLLPQTATATGGRTKRKRKNKKNISKRKMQKTRVKYIKKINKNKTKKHKYNSIIQ